MVIGVYSFINNIKSITGSNSFYWDLVLNEGVAK